MSPVATVYFCSKTTDGLLGHCHHMDVSVTVTNAGSAFSASQTKYFSVLCSHKEKCTWEHVVWCMDGSNPMFFFMSHSSPPVLIYCIYLTQPLHIWEYTLNIFLHHSAWTFLHCLKSSSFPCFSDLLESLTNYSWDQGQNQLSITTEIISSGTLVKLLNNLFFRVQINIGWVFSYLMPS